ncbi:MAG: acetylornithine/succinylornithine family transaminase [Clostridiaceae bacterium]
MNLAEEDRQYILPLYNRLPIEIVKGDGIYLYDKEGNKYLDFFSGIAVNILGHGNKRVISAIKNQLDKYIHLSNYFVQEPQVELAKMLVNNSFADKVFFANSGTESVEAMIKLARKYGVSKRREKVNFVALEKGFHGRTTGSLALTANRKYKDQFGELIGSVRHIPINDSEALINAVDENTCGIIMEPIQGEGGIQEVTPEFAGLAKSLCLKHDCLFLVDEIQSGLMRTGKLFAYEHWGVEPDAMTLGKGLGGGLPIGALLINEKYSEVLKPGDHGSTFGANPVACAAGVEVLKIITEETFKEEFSRASKYLIDGLISLKEKNPKIIKEIRGRGLMLGIDTGEYANTIKDAALLHRLLLNVTSGTVIRLLPPLNISIEEVQLFLLTLDNILMELK